MRHIERYTDIEPWSGIARYGSNIKSGPDQDNRYFYQQLEAMPNQLVETMFDKIKEGNQRFENIPYEVVLLGPAHIMTVRTPSIGHAEIIARLLLLGEHKDYGVINPLPWRAAETIAYARVSGHIYTPEQARVNVIEFGEDYKKMDELYWGSLVDPGMQERIGAVVNKREMIDRVSIPQ